ncbi:hypothetical protein Tco_0889660 [Tanacetum coccineum]
MMTQLTIERQMEKDVEDTYAAETGLKLKVYPVSGRFVRVWKSVRYGVSKGLDTAYWGFFRRIELHSVVVFGECWHGYAVSSLMDMAYWLSESLIFKISLFKLQNARLLLIFTKYSIMTAILKYKRLSK